MTTPDQAPSTDTRSREILAFLDTLQTLPGGAITACRGWTVHEIVAHLTAGCVAVADQAEAFGAGHAVPPFGSWQERDDAFRRIDDVPLRRRLDEAEARMTTAIGHLALEAPDLVIPGGGWGFSLTHLTTHFRQEFALHRWDLIGDDPVGEELLSSPDLAVHSVGWMGEWLLARGMASDPRPGQDFDARIRGIADDDVVLRVASGRGSLALAAPTGVADIVCADPAAGLLLIWGRRPRDSSRLVSRLPADRLMRLTSLLSGF